MAVYLSPGVFPREIDLSVLPTAASPLRPAFVGTAKKGPVGTPILITSSAQAIDTFGEPFSSSYLMYAVLAFLEEGNSCYVMRVGIECEDGQPAELSAICIDTSGARGKGWGRIPLFSGIDYGRINLRAITAADPVGFHGASVSAVTYNDAEVSTTEGATTATLNVVGSYTGSVDDSYVLVITGAPTTSAAASVEGATFQVIRNSDGEIVADGNLDDFDFNGTSQQIDIGGGLTVQVVVTAGVLDVNDTFILNVTANNRAFTISVNGGAAVSHQMAVATYTTVDDFVAAFNAIVVSEDYLLASYTLDDGTVIPQLRTGAAGERIQITGTAAWATEVGTQQYAWDIPRSYLIGIDAGPYDITTQNNRVKINVIGDATTQTVEFSVPAGLAQTATNVADAIDVAGVVSGDTLWDSFALTVPGGASLVVIVTSSNHQLDTLQMMANYSNLRTLRFAEQLNIVFPYKRAYRGFTDTRAILPDSGETTAATPLSCETSPTSAACALDSSYFQNVVGWLVAPSPGTWVDGYTVALEVFSDGVTPAGRYNLIIKDAAGGVVDQVSNISFDKRDSRYIGNVVNPGTAFGGTNGDAFVQWEERPAFLNNDINDTINFEVRFPSQFAGFEFSGQADGIPTDPAFSSELDAAVIGNPATSTGIYAFQNPESIDINLLCTPGFSTGSVIGTALQMCESRGDVLYIVDPPFGLRPQQVVDWHNGMLLSDLTAAINSSYGALYWGWVLVFDQFSANNIWIPPSGHVTAVFSRTAAVADQWVAPAGLRRGHLLTALDVEYSPTQGERDLLYGLGNAVNPIVNFPQDGIVVWGQRTLQREATALDRVGVRMLLIAIKKQLTQTLRSFIFELNDSILWSQVLATLNPILSDIQARRGVQAYKIVCDATNNTPDRIGRYELWVSVFLKPTRTVEFVALNITVLQTGASFSAEEVQAAGGIVGAATAV